MRWRWCRGRPRLPIPIIFDFETQQLLPVPIKSPEPIELTKEELQVLKLVDYENLTQIEAAEKLGCSRSKVWRLLKSGRKKLIQAIIEGRPIKII